MVHKEFYMEGNANALQTLYWIRAATRTGKPGNCPPPKFSQIWCHSHTSHEKLFLETALPLLELLLKTTLSHTCCVILDKTINQSMYHATENSQHRTRDKLWGASYEVKPVPSPRGALVGLSPQVKLQAPQNWNMKSYKSMQLLTTLNVKPTSAQT